ncbi:MAG: tetratricopeptide repeat protein [Acidobacteria bacterium]|nr:tetratricopeptide repeat protein [Acidobacteriota bacterium]
MMNVDERKRAAWKLFKKAYRAQMNGDLDIALLLYRQSIELFPTAEAYTYLGWAHSFKKRFEQAIDLCKQAIEIDPDFGHPYNDIGAYLIELDRLDEAIPWLEKAMEAPRYDARHYPYFNLGRLYAAKEMYNRALEMFRRALEVKPDYEAAAQAADRLKRLIN